MIAHNLTLTPALAAFLATRNDPGTAPLVARQTGANVEITRADGSDLSAAESAHVRGALAAHRVEPIK